MRRWEYCDNTVVLANADNYYTKEETEELIDGVSGMTPQEIQAMINEAIAPKADKTEVNELAEVVRQQGQQLLNTYNKTEVNDLLAQYLSKIEANEIISDYASVDGDVLILNSNNITN